MKSQNPIVRVELIDEDSRVVERQHDLVVLSVGMVPGYNPQAIYDVPMAGDGFIELPSPNISPYCDRSARHFCHRHSGWPDGHRGQHRDGRGGGGRNGRLPGIQKRTFPRTCSFRESANRDGGGPCLRQKNHRRRSPHWRLHLPLWRQYQRCGALRTGGHRVAQAAQCRRFPHRYVHVFRCRPGDDRGRYQRTWGEPHRHRRLCAIAARANLPRHSGPRRTESLLTIMWASASKTAGFTKTIPKAQRRKRCA